MPAAVILRTTTICKFGSKRVCPACYCFLPCWLAWHGRSGGRCIAVIYRARCVLKSRGCPPDFLRSRHTVLCSTTFTLSRFSCLAASCSRVCRSLLYRRVAPRHASGNGDPPSTSVL